MYVRLLGRRIRHARKQQGLTATALAEKLGVSLSYVSKIENGHVAPPPHVLARLEQLLGNFMAEAAPETLDPREGQGVCDPLEHLWAPLRTTPDGDLFYCQQCLTYRLKSLSEIEWELHRGKAPNGSEREKTVTPLRVWKG